MTPNENNSENVNAPELEINSNNMNNSPEPSIMPNQQNIEQYVQKPEHSSENKTPTNMSLVVLQWLTYAFWGWAILALSALTASVIAFFVNNLDTSEFSPFGIAALLTLLPIAVICDTIYIKKEPTVKKGAEVAITLIHAVIFALFGVGSLIAGVISLVTMFTNSDSSSDAKVVLFSSMMIATYYSIAFLRVMNIKRILRFRNIYKIVITVFSLIFILLSFVGPISRQRQTRDDRLIESGLGDVSRGIDNYTKANNKLPDSLNVLDLDSDAKILVDKNLVKYIKEGKNTNVTPSSKYYTSTTDSYHKYQLCVNFKFKSSGYKKSSVNYNSDQSYNFNYPSTYSHDSGEVCYKLRTSYSYNN